MTEPYEIIEDVVSGKRRNRPNWLKLLGEVRANRVKAIICWKYDRIGRVASEALTLADACKATKTDIISVSDGNTLLGPNGGLLYGILAILAERECEVVSERTKAGLAVAKAEGKIHGGSGGGYCHARTLEIAPAIMALRASGMTYRQIAKTMKCHTHTVQKILKEPESLIDIQEKLRNTPIEKRGKKFLLSLELAKTHAG
jgi:DNA invertase Pin-like site-specific DNA recombinase